MGILSLRDKVASCKNENEFQLTIKELVAKREQLTAKDLRFLVIITYYGTTFEETKNLLQIS